jgi:Fe-S-cluster formation regulator IscX/YfhJ
MSEFTGQKAIITAHSDVLEYVLGLNALKGEPDRKAHEIYYHHRSQLLPLYKQQQLIYETMEANFPDAQKAPELDAIDHEIARVYERCLEALKVYWLTESQPGVTA